MTTRVYDQHPLVEAIFELFADTDAQTRWTRDCLGELASIFPEHVSHEEHIREVGLELEMRPDGVVHQAKHEPRERVRRWDRQRHTAIQFGSTAAQVAEG